MSAPNSCVSCGAPLAGAYCAACGERAPDERTRTLGEFFGDALDAITNVNGKLLKSLRLLVFRPGFLSAEYARGARVLYMRPVQLFLAANLVFFLWSFVPIFSTPLQIHTWSQGFPHRAIAEAWAREAVAPQMAPADFRAVLEAWWQRSAPSGAPATEAMQGLQGLAQQFDARVELQGRALIVLMVPVFALWPGLFNFRRRPHAIEHLVFATHFMSFLLLAALAQMWLMRAVGAGLQAFAGVDASLLHSDMLNSLMLGVLMAAWLTPAVRRFYDRGWPAALLQALALVVLLLVTLQAYRSILFFTTWWSL
jgi:hypothetical protein